MDKSRTPPQNRYTRSAAKKINTPTSKTKTKENEDESKEDVNLSIRKTRRRSENKPKSNGDTAVDMDSTKLKSTSDMSDGNTLDGFELENSMSSEKRSKSPKECNLKTPSPTISRKSLRLRRSITPGPEVEINTPKRLRRSTSMTQLEPKSTQRNRRAQSVNKDFIYSPSKVNQESGMSESRSCFKLKTIGKIEECNEEDSSQDEYLSKYVEKSNRSNLAGNNKSPANNTSPTNSKVETDILINDETDSTSEPTSTSSNTADSELGPAHTVLHLIEEEDTVKVTDEQNVQLITQDVVIGKPISNIFTADKSELSPNVNLLPGMKAGDIHILPQCGVEIVMSDDDETDTKRESNSNERYQNLAVLPKIDEEDSASIADEQIIQPVERNVIVTSKPRISKAGKIELSPTVKLLPVIKEEDSVDGKKQTVIPNFGTVVNTGCEKATSKESEDLPNENSYLDTTSDNILKETLYEGTVENNPVKSIDYLEKERVPEDPNSMEVEAISDDELVEEKSVIKRSRSEFQISNMDASSEYGEISTIQSNNSVIFKNVSPGLKSIPVPVTRIYENNNDTFIQTFQNETEEIEIRNQEIDLQNREGSGSIVETFECSIVNTQSGLNSHLSQSTEDPLQDHRNVYETVPDEKNDCEKSDNVDVSKIILSEEQKSINEDFCYEAVKANTEDDNCREDKEGNKSFVLEYDEHDEVHEIVDDENSPDFGIQDDQMSHVEPKSANDDAYNGCESHLHGRVIDYIEEREEEVVINFRLPSESDNVANNTFQSQQNSNLTLEDNSPSNRLFSHNKTVSESDEQLGHQIEKNYKSSNDVEIINDTSSEANSDIYKDLSDCGISEQLGSPSNNYNDKYVSDNEEEDEEGGEELEHEIEDSEDKGEELEEEEGEEECEEECEDECEEVEEGEEDREEEDEEEIEEGGDKVAKNPVSTLKDKEIKNEIPSSFQINESQKNENVFDKEHPITYEKALEILNKDREKKINDDEFFEMYTEELRKVSAEEASDSDLQIVDEWIPENLPKPKPVIKGIKRPPQRPPSSMPRQPITPFHKLEAPFRAQTPYRVQTPYRGQVPQHQIPLHNLPQMQGLNYPQEGMYNPFNSGMTHMDSSRGPMMYNQFGAPNHNLPDPRICGPGNTMDNFSQPGMFNHPLGHMSEPAVQYNSQEIKSRNTGAMIRNNHLSSNQGFPAEPGKVSVTEFPEMNLSGSNPIRNNSNLAANIANSGISTPKKQVIKQKSNTSTSEDGDKIDTPVLNVLNLKPEQILHLKKVLGVIDKSSDEKMRARRPYTKKNINSKQRSHVLETTEDESEILTNKKEMTKEYLKRFLNGDRTLPASLRKAYNDLKPRPDRQVNLEGGSVAVTVAQKRKKWKKVKKLDRDRILLKEKRKRRKHNRRQKRDNMTSEDSSCSDSSYFDNFEKLFEKLNKKQKMAENVQNSSSSSEAPRSSKQLKRSNKCFSDRLITHEKMTQGKQQKKVPKLLKSNAGTFTVNSVTSTSQSSDLEPTSSGSSSEYVEEFRKHVQSDWSARKNKISNIFSQQSKEHAKLGGKKSKGEASSSQGTKQRKRVLRKLPDNVLEELTTEGKSSKKRGFTATDSDRPSKRRKRSSKIRVKSAAAEEEYIPCVTPGATQFALSRLDKEGVLGLAHKAANFRNNQLYGSPVKRITSNELMNIKKKQQLNGPKNVAKKKK